MTTDSSTGDWTPERERAIRERCERATPGPWEIDHEGLVRTASPEMLDEPIVLASTYPGEEGRLQWSTEDRAFIAHARADLPAALAEIERLRARPTLTEEQAETLTDMIESVESPASEGWTLPSGQNVIIKAPGGHLSIVHTSSLQRWAGKLREILDAARGETGEPGAGDTVWTGVSVIARPAAAKEAP